MAFRQYDNAANGHRIIGSHLTGTLAGGDVSRGIHAPGMFGYLVTGYRQELGIGSPVSVGNGPNGTLIWPVLTAGLVEHSIVSTSAADSAAGTGARAIVIYGVDSDGYLRTELVILNGTTPVLTANQYYLIANAVVVDVGSAGQQGTISLTQGGVNKGNILPQYGALLQGHMLVPKNYYFYYTQQVMGGNADVQITGRLQFNVLEAVNPIRSLANRFTVEKTQSVLNFQVPAPFPPGTFTAFSAEGNNSDSAVIYFEGYFVHKDLVEVDGHILSAPPGTVYNVDTLI